MDVFKQIETFIKVAALGSLSAVARQEGCVSAMISRRLDALENRLGVKLLLRTTRRVELTQEGVSFLEDAQRIMTQLSEAESAVASGISKAGGHLRISAPAGFGRKHVAPLLPAFRALHPQIKISLDLSDRLVDVIKEQIDVAIRISDLSDSRLVAIRLADNYRVVVAAPSYLQTYGTPSQLEDLSEHQCLSLGESQSRGWTFLKQGKVINLRVGGALECNDGAVLHDWAIQGMGLAWRSLWEVKADIKQGSLVTVLDRFASPDYPIYAVIPQRRYLPQRVRLFIEFLKLSYQQADYWDEC